MAEKILIVDDDADFREELRDYLEGYEVVEASCGREALRLLSRANEISLELLDVNMPGLCGTEVLREIKRTDPNLGIIILTGYSSKDVAIEALKGHADDYIEKPLDPEKIKEIINRVLQVKRVNGQEASGGIEGKIKEARRFAERNCYKKISLKDTAEAVCLSPKYLSRVFKENTGESFSEYRLRIKIKKAKELLDKSGYNVNEVSNKLGYENAESFIRQFKKITGYTPTGYRKKIRKKKKNADKKK
jgi:YesN/AraC family two-component response regulator